MSDLQELIAKNAVMSFNEGFDRGQQAEQERIIKLLKEYDWIDMQASEVIGLIIGEQK
jgi:hypothetical protein